MSRPAKPPIQRFETNYQPEPFSGCWLWTGHVPENFYGQFRMTTNPQDRAIGAHRASWLLYRGEIPDGMCVCHRCDVMSCVNPDHLFLGTYRDNMQDASKKGRMNWKPGEKRNLPVGERHPGAKLTDADVLAIRSSQEKGTTLAARFRVSNNTISRVRLRKIWTHVEGSPCRF